MFSKIVLASSNAGKLREFSQFFNDNNIELISQNEFNIPECLEPYNTFIENALAKARHAAKYSGLPVLADDSGICFPALNGAPGVYSARFAGDNPKSDVANNEKVNAKLIECVDKRCYYVCVLVLLRYEKDPLPIIAEGIWHGKWQSRAMGNYGFGYDPHFYIEQLDKTAAQLTTEQKNVLSHRALALKQLKEKLFNLN